MTPKSRTTDAKKVTLDVAELKSVLVGQKEFLQPVVREAVQTILELEMEESLQAGRHERTDQRLGYRSGYYRRRLITRVGTIVLRVPQDRAGHFSTQVFEQYQRSEKALVVALAAMYVRIPTKADRCSESIRTRFRRYSDSCRSEATLGRKG